MHMADVCGCLYSTLQLENNMHTCICRKLPEALCHAQGMLLARQHSLDQAMPCAIEDNNAGLRDDCSSCHVKRLVSRQASRLKSQAGRDLHITCCLSIWDIDPMHSSTSCTCAGGRAQPLLSSAHTKASCGHAERSFVC